MSSFDIAVEFVIGNEGKNYVDSPNDRGGATKFGISLRFLKNLTFDTRKKYGIFDIDPDEETIRDLTIEQAKSIYQGEFWAHQPFEKIRNQEHCNYIFDMAINMGIRPSIRCVQRACWSVMKKWELLKDDGVLGDKTLAAIEKCGMFIMPPMRAERGNYYRNIVERFPDQKANIDGWFNRAYNT